MIRLRQAELVDGRIHTIAWIPSGLCKKSQHITDGCRSWIVLHAYRVELTASEINHGWRVGGL